jgi:hypothetical protein
MNTVMTSKIGSEVFGKKPVAEAEDTELVAGGLVLSQPECCQ